LSFRVANDVGFGNSKTTQWVSCSFWGKRGEAVANFIKKGDKITVVGELKLEQFTTRDGKPDAKLAVRVNDVDLAARSDGASTGSYVPDHQAPLGGGGGQDYGTQTKGGAGGRGGGKPAFDQSLDDEIPFLWN
jgi:single-strand DNA-binding protein